jgi:DNA mismatch repair protein MutS2
VVTALGEYDAEVQIGSLRVRAKLSELQRKSPQAEIPEPDAAIASTRVSNTPSPSIELDIRGRASDEALEMLDHYIDKAFSAGLPFVRIIHGKGTGVLRKAVRAALKRNKQILSFEEGGHNEGGEGVTIAKIASE